MSQVAPTEPAVAHALPDAAAPSTLAATVEAVLRSACDAARLATLELAVTGAPGLATAVRRPVALPELALWLSPQPATRWHGGLVLVASAEEADAERRAVVTHTGVVVSELVAADGRAGLAESLARRALGLAGVDPLTQVGNRRTWRRALSDESRRAARYASWTTLVVVDLDGLKRTNDERGHAAGDAYLQRTAAALRSAARSVDVVCRLGGDEFAVLAPQTDEDGAARLAVRLRAALNGAGVAASIGIATARDGALEDAWQRADAAMYVDKRARRDPAGPLER